MGIWDRLFGRKMENLPQIDQKKNDSPLLFFDPINTKILKLPDFYWAALEDTMATGKEKDPINYVNQNLHVRCPKCGIDYNANGFEIGYLASLISTGRDKISFASGGAGIYPRCLTGACPNNTCSSDIATIRWIGDKNQSGRVPYGTLVAAFIFKKGDKPPSQSECNSFLNEDLDYRKGGLVEIRTFGGIPRNVDISFLLMLFAKNSDKHLLELFSSQLATWTVIEKNDLMMIKIFETFYVDNPPGFFIIAFVLSSNDNSPTNSFCTDFVGSDSDYKLGRAGKVQIHPISGWDRKPPTSVMAFKLLNHFHPNMIEGVKKREIYYDLRWHEGDKEYLLMRIFGNKYWNDIVSKIR